MNYLKSLTVSLFLFLGLLGAELALAQNPFPASVDDYVNDFAGVIREYDSSRIRDSFGRLEQQTGIEAVVVTINSVHDYSPGSTIEDFAFDLFNTWGIGHKAENNGILVLFAKNDREARIELGGAYGRRYDGQMQEIMNHVMIPNFKQGDYGRGLYEGSQEIIDRFTKEVSWLEFYGWHLAAFAGVLALVGIGISLIKSGRKGWGWAVLALAFAILIGIIKTLPGGKSKGGFGGGSSGGGGATGKW